MCDDCRVTRLVELENRQAALAEPRPVKARWRRLTGEERDDLLRAAPEEVGSLIAALQRSRVTSAEIAAVLGRSQKWMRAPIPAPTGEPRTEGPQPSLCTALSTAVGETTATPPG